jgi:importin subunit alpha-2
MKRTEVNVELKKSQKEDHLPKPRNLEIDDEPLSPLETTNLVAAANMSIEDIINGMFVAAFVFSSSYFLIFFFLSRRDQ